MGMEAKTLKYQAKFKVKLSLKASGHVLLRLLESSKEMKPLWAKATLYFYLQWCWYGACITDVVSI